MCNTVASVTLLQLHLVLVWLIALAMDQETLQVLVDALSIELSLALSFTVFEHQDFYIACERCCLYLYV